jgi:hypothetical protein
VIYLCRDYVDLCTAVTNNLTFATDDTFIMRADDKNVVSSNERGRKTVRMKSTQTFTHHLVMYV